MLNELNNNIKFKEYIYIANTITKILGNKKKKQYSKKEIEVFENILNTKTTQEIIEFMFKNNLNLKEAISLNYRQIQIIYNSNQNDISKIKYFDEYKQLEKEIHNIVKNNNNKKNIINYLKVIYQNSSRIKGNLFKQTFDKILLEKESRKPFMQNKIILNNINTYTIYQDVIKLTNNEDFIYFPEEDKRTKDVLKSFGIKLKNEKGRDFLARYKRYYFLGEAKEIHELGGSQTNQFKDMLSCIEESNTDNKLIGIGILYGACLMYNNKYQKETTENHNILSISELTFNLKERFDKLIENL